MLTVPVFGPWRPIWNTALGQETRRLDELATERNKGRIVPPLVGPDILRLIRKPQIQTVLWEPRLLAVGDFLKTIQEIEPLLKACVWPRWLLLEAAFDDAARSGDLYLSALVLRTQIEELDSLRIVGKVLSHNDEASWNDSAISYSIRMLNSRILPRLRTKTNEQLVEQSANPDDADFRPEKMQRVFDHLSEYVHPNYGSHILSVRPHLSEFATMFVEAFVVIYEEFLSLPWAKEVDGNPSLPRTMQVEFRNPFLVLAEDTVRRLAPSLPFDKIGPVPWIDAVNCFHRRAEGESNQEASASLMENGEVSGGPNLAVEPFCMFRKQSVPIDHWPEIFRTAAGRVEYASLVEQENQLVRDAERFVPGSGERDEKTWLAVLVSGLTFAINIIEYKVDLLANQAARQINSENVLGATLAVRSILEYHSLAIDLGTKLQNLWHKAEKVAPGKEVADALDEAEKQIARILAGSSKSSGASSLWRTMWEQIVRKPYHVLDPVRTLDAKRPGFLKTYGLLSHTIHGTTCTGGDLLGIRAGDYKAGQPMLAQLILFLADLSDFEAMLGRQAVSMIIADRLNVIRNDSQELRTSVKGMRLLEGQKLKVGRDIIGSGTANDPYRFRDGLLYHDAYYHYLKQEGIQMRSRRIEKLGEGFGDRVDTEDGRVLYFLNDKLPMK